MDDVDRIVAGLTARQQSIIIGVGEGETVFYKPQSDRLCWMTSLRPALLVKNPSGGYGFTPVGHAVRARLAEVQSHD